MSWGAHHVESEDNSTENRVVIQTNLGPSWYWWTCATQGTGWSAVTKRLQKYSGSKRQNFCLKFFIFHMGTCGLVDNTGRWFGTVVHLGTQDPPILCRPPRGLFSHYKVKADSLPSYHIHVSIARKRKNGGHEVYIKALFISFSSADILGLIILYWWGLSYAL